VQAKAKQHLHAIWMAETREAAEAAFDQFVDTYEAKYDKAVACLVNDREPLLAFYDFPAEHWKHIRTTDEIDKRFVAAGAMISAHGRPRGEERGRGWNPRRAAYG
jgi:putative transposase